MNPESCELLPWDSAFFGMRVARVRGASLSEVAMAEVKSYGDAERIDCIYFLADADDACSAAVAQASGFRFVDLRVTLERSVGDYLAQETPAIRPFEPADLPTLRAIARSSHQDSRFYADSHFPRAACERLYDEWLNRSCAGWAKAVLVAECGGAPAGYLTCHVEAGQAGSIGLFAVARQFRGRGLGRQLIGACLEYFRGQKAERVTVVTQGRNVASQRLYQRCGFLAARVQVWYHRWSDCL
jgi:dTDP-4-amino-4,6-dideoxy-D-galactose acyltransferase